MSRNLDVPTGKGEKARYRLNAIEKEIKGIKEQLDNAREALITIIVVVPKQAFSEIEKIDKKESEEIWEELKGKGYIDENGKITDKFQPNEKQFKLNVTFFKGVNKKDIIKILQRFKDNENDIRNGQKKRAMIKNAPNRIEFEFNDLKFYIDFTLEASEFNDLIEINGSIIYGTNRTICFSKCIFPKNPNNYEKCERVVRCDGLEDKPLIQFSVNRNGIIKSKDKLENEMWTTDKKDLLNLYYITLDLIWKDALGWANEILVP